MYKTKRAINVFYGFPGFSITYWQIFYIETHYALPPSSTTVKLYFLDPFWMVFGEHEHS